MGAKVGNPGRRNSKRLAPERLQIIDQMLHECYTHSAIVTVCSRQWSVSPRQVRNYIKKVYEQWDEDSKKTFVDRVDLRRKQLEGVLEVAMQQKPPDLRTAVQALDRLCRVDGAFAPERIEGTFRNVNSVAAMTSDEQRKELDALFERYGKLNGRGSAQGNGKANGSGLPH